MMKITTDQNIIADGYSSNLEIVAEKAHPKDVEKFSQLYPLIFNLMKQKATHDFCVSQINALQKNVKSKSFQHGFKFIWFLLSTIAALLNVRAAYSVAPGDWDIIRLPIAIPIAFALIFGADWVIATEVNDFKARNQSTLVKQGINEKEGKAENLLQKQRVESEKEIFSEIQKEYIHNFNFMSVVKILGLVAYLLVEYYAAVRALAEYGEQIDFILPLLGTILNIFTGVYKGYEVLYSEHCQKLIKQYKNILNSVE